MVYTWSSRRSTPFRSYPSLAISDLRDFTFGLVKNEWSSTHGVQEPKDTHYERMTRLDPSPQPIRRIQPSEPTRWISMGGALRSGTYASFQGHAEFCGLRELL
jgi:hypothetical protein